MNRGDRREVIFGDDEHRERLLQTLTEACSKTGWQVHAHGLMRNHFHLAGGGGCLGSGAFSRTARLGGGFLRSESEHQPQLDTGNP